MATVYYKQFDAILIDANGARSAAANLTLDVDNITTAASLGTVTTDNDGIVAEGSFTADPGDVIEFSHATYPGVFRQTLTSTQAEAYTLADNGPTAYILEDLQSTTTEATTGDIYAQDLDNPLTQPFFLGTVQSGITNKIPYQTTLSKNLRLYLVSRDTTGRRSGADLTLATSVDMTIPGTRVGGLEYETITETTEADFDAGTLSNVTGNADGTLTLADAANGTTKAVRFQGSRTNKITVPHNAAYDITGDMTLEAWVKLENPLSFSTIISKGESGGPFDFVIQSGGGTGINNYGWLRFGQAGSYISTEGVATVRLNKWQHVAVVKTGTSVKFFINGVLVRTVTGFNPTVVTDTDDVTIGHSPDATVTDGYIFRGSLYDVRIWNVARSDAEIAANFTTLTPADAGSNLKGQWKMQEGTGTTIADTGTAANNGTLSGNDYAWQTITENFATSGNRVSPVYDISEAQTISTSLIEWDENVPVGHTLAVETRYSTDGGSNWSAYAAATNGAAIPGLSSSTDLSNGRLQIRETFTSPTSKATATLEELTATFTTPAFDVNMGVRVDDPQAALDAGINSVQGSLYDTGGAFLNVCSPRYGAVGDGVTDNTAAFRAALADLGSARAYTTSVGVLFVPRGIYYFASDFEINHIIQLIGSGADNAAPGTTFLFADGKHMSVAAAEVLGGYGTDQGAGKGSLLRGFKIKSQGKTNVPSSTVDISGLNITRTAGTLFNKERWGAGTIVKINGFYARIDNWLSDTTATLRPLYYKGTVSGSTVTLAQGNPFPAGLTSVAVKIDGVSYNLHASTASTATVLTLSSSPAETGTRDIEIQSLGTISGADMDIMNVHGLQIDGTTHLEHITIQGFAGNGIDINTAFWNYENARNSNTCSFVNVMSIDNEGNGMFVFGSNANASSFVMLNVFNNRGCGLLEASQFGNTYTQLHADSNGMEPVHCENASLIAGIYCEGTQPSCRLKHSSGSGTGGPLVLETFNGASRTYDSDNVNINADGRVSGLHSLSTLLAGDGINLGSLLNFIGGSDARRVNFGYGIAGSASSAQVQEVTGSLYSVTNTRLSGGSFGVPTDTSQPSWEQVVSSAIDKVRWRRAPATSGTPSFTQVAEINATGFSGDGSQLTGLNATNLGSGTVPTARLGSGTADNTTFLRGDNTWATPAGGGGGTTLETAYQTADATYTSDDSLNNTELSVSVEAGGIYAIELNAVIDNGAGWFKCDFNGGDATITNFRIFAVAHSLVGSTQSPIAANVVTSIATAIAFGTTEELKGVSIRGSVEINATGTFIFRACQFSSNADPSTFYRGASIILTKMN